jgi:hypothetical protein
MDITFLIGLFIGAILSLIASIAANLYTDSIRAYFSSRRKVRLSNKKLQELKTYKSVSDLKRGTPSALLIHQQRGELVPRLFMLAIMVLVLFVALGLTPQTERAVYPKLFASLPPVFFAFFIVLVSTAYARLLSQASNVYKAAHFEQYESDIRAKWGNDAI